MATLEHRTRKLVLSLIWKIGWGEREKLQIEHPLEDAQVISDVT